MLKSFRPGGKWVVLGCPIGKCPWSYCTNEPIPSLPRCPVHGDVLTVEDEDQDEEAADA